MILKKITNLEKEQVKKIVDTFIIITIYNYL
jgi:hypothetical protein